MDREHRDSFDETVEKVRFLVTDAIRRQMVSDVPIGTFLSGGLDSSIITAVCAGEMEKRGERLKTFSVDYLNNDKYFQANKFQPNSEDVYKRQEQISSTLSTPERFSIFATISMSLPPFSSSSLRISKMCIRDRPM